MQSILFLVYILMPLTNGIGMFNSGVPKVPNSHNIYELYNKNGKKKSRQVVIQKVNEDESPHGQEIVSVEDQDSDKLDSENPLALSAHFDLRRQNTANTEPPKINVDFPIPGGLMGEYNPYPTLLRQVPNAEEGVNIDSPSSSESFRQYFPVPPFPQERVENDIFIQRKGEKDMFLPGRGENDVPIVQPQEYSSLPKERAVPEVQEYNGEMEGNTGYNRYDGGNKGYDGGNKGYHGGNNEYNEGNRGYDGGNNVHNVKNKNFDQDMNEYNKVIKDLTPPEKMWVLVDTSLDQGLKQKELSEKYKRIENMLNGKVIEKDPFGGSNSVEQVVSANNVFNKLSNGFNGGHNGFEGSNEAKPDRQGYSIQYTGVKAKNKGHNREIIENHHDMPTYTEIIKALPRAWTSKSLDMDPKEQEIWEKYKRILKMFK